MTRNHRHATDRVDGQVVAECPNKEYPDDGHLSASFEYGHAVDDDWPETFTDVFTECGKCGAELDSVTYEEPSEVLD